MSVTPSPIGGFAAQFFDNNGVILSGGKIYTYAAGTTTPQATYTSAAGVTPHANPIILDSAGRVPGGEIWLTDGLIYKFVIETATSILLGTYDNITGVNSNFVNYTVQEEVQTATAGQTVFNLTTINYTPGTNSLTVYIDGVNQYVGDSYLETDSTTVTFTSGVHVGGEVKFTTAIQTTTGAVDASIVSYDPPFTGGVATNVQDKLAEYVSVKDFGATGNGTTNDAAAIQAAIDGVASGGVVTFPTDTYLINTEINVNKPITLMLQGSTITSSASNLFTITSSGVLIDGEYAQISHTGNGVAIRSNPPSDTNYTNVEVVRLSIAGTGTGAGGILFRNVHYGRVDAFLTGYSAGYGLTIEGHPTGAANDFAMRCVVEGTTRIENHLYGIVLGGVNGPANANEIHARVTACTVGITWIIGRPNYISNANIEFCPTGIDGSTHTPDGVLTVIGCNFENNTTDVTNANSANTRIAVYQSDIFSVSDPGQRMIISNMGAVSGGNTSLRIQQWGEGFRYTAPPFSVIPTSTFGGDVYVNTLSGSGGSLFVKSGLGYGAGAGTATTQTGSRTSNVNAASPCGSITLVSAAGSTSWTSFSVLTNFVSETDTVIVNQKSGTDKYRIHVTEVVNGAFQVTFATTGGTTVESPVFNFSVIQSVAS